MQLLCLLDITLPFRAKSLGTTVVPSSLRSRLVAQRSTSKKPLVTTITGEICAFRDKTCGSCCLTDWSPALCSGATSVRACMSPRAAVM